MPNEEVKWKRRMSEILTIPEESIETTWLVCSMEERERMGERWPWILWIKVGM